MVVIYLPPLSRYQELKSEEERITKELAELSGKIEKLEKERELLQNDVRYLEKVIRKEMGLVRPGEVVYRVVEKSEGAPSQTDSDAPVQVIQEFH